MNNLLKKLTGLVTGRGLIISIPYVWLLVLFLIPFFIVLKISFAEPDLHIPPYTPLLNHDAEIGQLTINLTYYNYTDIFENFWGTLTAELNPFTTYHGENIYLQTYISSLKIAFTTTIICLLLGYPIAYAVARARPNIRNILLLAIMLPFWTSFLLRVYAWMGLLSTNGIINHLLMDVGLIDEPLQLFYNSFSLHLIMVYTYLPFMILPLYTNLVKMDYRLLEAANDLGAGPIKAFWNITVPLSKGGIIAGALMVFIPSVGEYVIPELTGGPSDLMIGKVLWQAFFDQNNWPLASAIAVLMVLLLVIPIALFHRHENRQVEGGRHA